MAAHANAGTHCVRDPFPSGLSFCKVLRGVVSLCQVILTDEGVSRWLSDAKFENVKDLLVSYPVRDLQWHPVDKRGMDQPPSLSICVQPWFAEDRIANGLLTVRCFLNMTVGSTKFQSENCATKVDIKHAGASPSILTYASAAMPPVMMLTPPLSRSINNTR